ncbi:MAG TPA: PD-(D/E)XK nuclease family protein [Solirubrobacteraceae bacterium]|nr:PD-(D/E)XK nuclease family protein [Solirubrobacteraceae bacterium]
MPASRIVPELSSDERARPAAEQAGVRARVSGTPFAEQPARAGATDDVAGRGAAGADASFLRRAEVRDVLAWVRLLVDPQDAAAVVRALGRPPIELRQAHLARVIQVARRRKLDLVAGLGAASEAPQVAPEARERIARFVALHRSAAAAMERKPPDEFLCELIELLGTPGRSLLAPDDVAEQRASLQRLRDLAGEIARAEPRPNTRELARRLAAVVPEARGAIAAGNRDAPAHLGDATDTAAADSPDAHLEASFQQLREEVLDSVARIGGRLGELRLDTELDVSHGIVRYLELVKLAALLQRPSGQDIAEALSDVNARLLAAATPLQREIMQTSPLDDALVELAPLGAREEHSLDPFLPRKGTGLALSASDIETYRSCPLRYKFARVLRIPTEQTLHQRFGIAVHQVLERFHAGDEETLARINELLDVGWRRAGFGDSEPERKLLDVGRTALARYHARLHEQDSEPVWFERSFSFRLGPHHLRGRVDRVDRVNAAARGGGAAGAEAEYELIDYKTSRAKTAEQLHDDVQLSLYAIAAREDWKLPSSRAAYYYVLDDVKVPVPCGERDEASVTETVMAVGEGILAHEFEPTPSHAACSICDYRIVCPAAER